LPLKAAQGVRGVERKQVGVQLVDRPEGFPTAPGDGDGLPSEPIEQVGQDVAGMDSSPRAGDRYWNRGVDRAEDGVRVHFQQTGPGSSCCVFAQPRACHRCRAAELDGDLGGLPARPQAVLRAEVDDLSEGGPVGFEKAGVSYIDLAGALAGDSDEFVIPSGSRPGSTRGGPSTSK
jgi:hypothetical protein